MKIFDGVTLTADFANNRVALNTVNRNGGVLLIDFAKNDSDALEVLVETSPPSDTPGAEDWHPLCDQGSGSGARTIAPIFFEMTVTGKYRIEISGIPGEDKIRISLRAPVPGATAGVTTVYSVI